LEKKVNKLFILEDIAHRQIIGHCGLYDFDVANGNCVFGILIGLPDYWQGGIGFAATMATIAEARKIDGIHQIHLHVLKENTRAIHIYEKAGFKTTRILTAHVVKNGMAKDIVHMTLQLI
ncbi:MAG TPA: GNAT family protein, partial [Chitinophagales bacterium]|nr:GNAT family protein [Chitinophagales bacterium]